MILTREGKEEFVKSSRVFFNIPSLIDVSTLSDDELEVEVKKVEKLWKE